MYQKQTKNQQVPAHLSELPTCVLY